MRALGVLKTLMSDAGSSLGRQSRLQLPSCVLRCFFRACACECCTRLSVNCLGMRRCAHQNRPLLSRSPPKGPSGDLGLGLVLSLAGL